MFIFNVSDNTQHLSYFHTFFTFRPSKLPLVNPYHSELHGVIMVTQNSQISNLTAINSLKEMETTIENLIL